MEGIDKEDVKQRAEKYVRAMRYYKKFQSRQGLRMESKRYLQDHFSPDEIEYLKRKCPIMVRIKLKLMGANVF